MIKVIDKKVAIDEETFKPVLILTIFLNLELAQDNKAIDDKFYENLGRNFEKAVNEYGTLGE